MEGNDYHRVIIMDKNKQTGSVSTPLPHRERLGSGSKIYVAGHKGLVGSAIWRNLKERGYTNLVGRTHAELDLTWQPPLWVVSWPIRCTVPTSS